LRWRPVDSFFPPCGFEPAMLEESVSNHGHERVAVEALPGSPLEVVETQFFAVTVTVHLTIAPTSWPQPRAGLGALSP
jgi:hypothetical protein